MQKEQVIADNGQGSEILSKHPFLSRQFLYDHSMHFSEQIQHQLHFPSPTKEKNYPSRAQLSFPRNFLALKIMGKAQECDLSVTGHLIGKNLSGGWSLAPFSDVLKHSQFACWPSLQPPHSHADTLNRDIHVSIFLTRLYQEAFLDYCSRQVVFVFLTFTRSHLWESQLFPVSFSPWIPKLPEAMRQLLSQNPDPSESGSRSRHCSVLWCSWCSWLVLIWSWMFLAAAKVPSFSWGPEP